MLNITPIAAFHDNYIWLISDNSQRTACCVDPGDAIPLLGYLKQHSFQLTSVLLTHHHYDHIGGLTELLKTYPKLKIYGPRDSRIPAINHVLLPDTEETIAQCTFHILATPGHTSTHISLYAPHFEWLFCGDTLFSGGCGRVFDGTIEELHDSLQRLKALPDSTQIFPAHEYTRENLRFGAFIEPNNLAIQHYLYQLNQHAHCTLPSTIGLEKEINPFFRTQAPEIIEYAQRRGDSTGTSLSVFKQLRSDKNIYPNL